MHSTAKQTGQGLSDVVLDSEAQVRPEGSTGCFDFRASMRRPVCSQTLVLQPALWWLI